MSSPHETPRLMPTTSRLHRLAYYMIGLAIGLMLVGLIVTTRNRYLHQPAPGPEPATTGAAASNAATAPASGDAASR